MKTTYLIKVVADSIIIDNDYLERNIKHDLEFYFDGMELISLEEVSHDGSLVKISCANNISIHDPIDNLVDDTVALNNMDPVEIFNFCYSMEMCGGGDVWRYQGNAPFHPTCYSEIIRPSGPIELDEQNLLLKTQSGRLYKIMSFAGDKQKIVDQIKKDIQNNGFEIH